MKKLSIHTLLVLTLLIFSNFAIAADESTHPFMIVPPVVVSASRLEQPLHEVGSSVTILSAEELLERDVHFVADALLEVPSLLVTSQGPRGSQTQIRIRGNEANHVLVLIDGARVSDASTGEFDLANLPIDGIEKIEVLLGPQSTLYGSDAAAGVISITTNKGRKGFGGHVRTTEGSMDTHSQSAQFFGGDSGWHYSVNANRHETSGISAANEENGNTEKDAYDTHSVNAKVGFDSKKLQTWFAINKAHSSFEFDRTDDVTGYAIDDPDNQQWVDSRGFSWITSFPSLNKRLTNQIQISEFQNDNESYYYASWLTAYSTSITNTNRKSIGYQGNFKVNDKQTLIFGAEKIREELDASSLSIDKDLNQSGTYLQWLVKVSTTDISVGARQDKHDEFGSHSTYRLTAKHPLNNEWKVRGVYGTGFKAPGLGDLYMPSFLGGNPDLEPEKSSSVEMGIEYRKQYYHSSITMFKHHTDNLIRYISTTGLLENADNVNGHGVELNLGLTKSQMDLNASITWLDASETIDGVKKDRLRVPEWAGNLIASYFYPSGRIWAQAQYRGKRDDQQFLFDTMTFTYSTKDITLDEYWLFHTGASYELTNNATVSLRLENLTNIKYEEIFSYGTRGRTSSVTIDWRF